MVKVNIDAIINKALAPREPRQRDVTEGIIRLGQPKMYIYGEILRKIETEDKTFGGDLTVIDIDVEDGQFEVRDNGVWKESSKPGKYTMFIKHSNLRKKLQNIDRGDKVVIIYMGTYKELHDLYPERFPEPERKSAYKTKIYLVRKVEDIIDALED